MKYYTLLILLLSVNFVKCQDDFANNFPELTAEEIDCMKRSFGKIKISEEGIDQKIEAAYKACGIK